MVLKGNKSKHIDIEIENAFVDCKGKTKHVEAEENALKLIREKKKRKNEQDEEDEPNRKTMFDSLIKCKVGM